jgi:ubiquinone/menaquinone biosynthesis C-methylase UbiE
VDQYDEFIDPYRRASANLFIRVEHLARYLYAADITRKRRLKRVLDCACGNGYGCRVLATQTASVTGVDKNNALIAQGTQLIPSQPNTNIVYHTVDLNDGLGLFDSSAFDCITCFETLEHVDKDEALLNEFQRVLRRGGALLLSVPKAGYEPVGVDGKPTSPYHLRLYDVGGLNLLLQNHGFAVERSLSQPYTNVSRANMESFRRDKGILQEEIDSYFVETPESLEFFARIWGWPVADAAEKSNVIFLVCRRL